MSNIETTENDKNDIKKLEFIFGFATPSLYKYLLQKFDLDLTSVYKVPTKSPEIKINRKDDIYSLTLDIVDKDYSFNFYEIIKEGDEDEEKIKSDIVEHLTFLINAVNSSFNFFKRTIKTSKDSNDYILIEKEMKLDENTNLYIDEDDEFRIGIIIKKN